MQLRAKWFWNNGPVVYKTISDYYTRSVQMREEQRMGVVGNAIDRRALRHLLQDYNEDQLHSLLCFICGKIYPNVSGPVNEAGPYNALGRELWTRCWYPPRRMAPGNIRYYSIAQTLEQ